MKPLAGLRIVVTRAAHQAEELAQPLAALGAEVILLPVIGIAPPENPEPLAEPFTKLIATIGLFSPAPTACGLWASNTVERAWPL